MTGTSNASRPPRPAGKGLNCARAGGDRREIYKGTLSLINVASRLSPDSKSVKTHRCAVQITHVEVIPVEFDLRLPYRVAHSSTVEHVAVVFVRIETRQGDVAWGCAALDPAVTSDTLEEVTRVCQACADRVTDLNPLNLEFALAELAQITDGTPSARCALDQHT